MDQKILTSHLSSLTRTLHNGTVCACVVLSVYISLYRTAQYVLVDSKKINTINQMMARVDMDGGRVRNID